MDVMLKFAETMVGSVEMGEQCCSSLKDVAMQESKVTVRLMVMRKRRFGSQKGVGIEDSGDDCQVDGDE